MKRVHRLDVGTLARPERTPEGWLRAEAHTAKVGILEYEEPGGGTRRELVLAEELFDDASRASARMVPLTYRHPEKLLDATTARVHQVGSVGENIRPDGDLLAAPIMVTDADAVKGIEDGDQQMSWGYDCDLDPTPGTHPQFGPYDAIQRRRRYNHLAIVNTARAGNQARIRLDAAGNACDPFATAAPPVVASDPSTRTPEPSMPAQIKIGDHRFDNSEAAAPLIQQEIDRVVRELTARADSATAAQTAAATEAAKEKKRADGLKARFAASLARIRAKLDGMKARMMGCDECGGSGKVMDAGGAEAKCDYCDGAGSLRMHEMVKAAPSAEGPHPDEDLAEIEEETDSGVPERESAAEEKLETVANPDHPKLDAAKKSRADARAATRATLRQKRADSLERRATRRAVERAALLATAGKHLGAEEKLDGKPDLDIKRAVVAKLAPHVKLDGMAPAVLEVLFTSETARADASGPAPAPQLSEADRLRAAVASGNPAGVRAPAARVDADMIHVSVIDAKANAYKRPAKA